MRDFIEKAREIRAGSASAVLKFRDEYNTIKSSVQGMTDLSDAERAYHLEVRQKAKKAEFIRKAKSLRDEYDQNVQKAIEAADKVINVLPSEPEKDTLRKYENGIADIRTQALFNPERAVQSLQEYVDGITDPYQAEMLSRSFHEIAAQLHTPLTGSQLMRIHGTLKDKATTPEQKEAQRVKATAESMRGRDIFIPVAVERIGSLLGPDYARYANDPASFPA